MVEGVFAVTRKERRRTRTGAAFLSLELADASGRIEARVWSDVELLDRRFDQGDAVRVLGRVERFGNRLQVQVRALETAEDADPEALTPTLKRDADELDGFFEFLAAEIAHPGSSATPGSAPRSARSRPRAQMVITATLAGSSSTRSVSRLSAGKQPSSIRAYARTCCSLLRSCTTSAARASFAQVPHFRRPRRVASSDTSISGCG